MRDSLFAPCKLTPAENRKTRIFCGAAAAFLLFGVPLLLCAIYKLGDFGTVGPWVLITGLFNLAALPILAIHSVEGLTRRRGLNAVLLALAFTAGIGCAVLGMNIFIGVTWLFGLFDYSLW
jgi:hypothetical protein